MDEEKDDKLEEEGKKSKKKKGKGLIVIIIVVVAVLIGGGGAFFFLSKSGGYRAQKKEKDDIRKDDVVMFALDPFVVNLNDQGATRFLKVSIQLELASAPNLESAKARTPQIRDAIITLLTSKTSDSLMSPEGKLQLKDEINLMTNQILGNNTVKNVYLTEFVMQ
ncbi:MAG TPA: flagellar basal body-associated protein FliL [Dissulfurispiraceae bacterium]|nr:flagellar basal body-associated protein FliL [Dissulfurispiraceae bacterium]